MASGQNWLDIFQNNYLSQMKRPEFQSANGFNPNTAYGDNMVSGSSSINLTPGRDAANALYGQLGGSSTGGLTNTNPSQTMDSFKKLLAGAQGNSGGDNSGTLFGGMGQPLSQGNSGFSMADLWEKLQQKAPDIGMGVGASLAQPLGNAIGGRQLGNATGAAATTGLAAAQGFENPLTDAAAAMKLYQMMRGWF
jgi:hypothetical protein